jgi:hypothetical protein
MPPDSASEPEQEDRFGAKPKLLSLTKLEHDDVKKHMPKHQGKDVCLSFCTHDGCKLGDKCNNAYVTLSRERQHAAVQLYFLSKHGHKSSTKMLNSEAQAAQRALRAESSVKAAKKRVGATAKAKTVMAKSKSR